ncbi:MAG: hypothetical protein R3224_02450 [Balneolaceae bacterium]|nr:hypothetical protein [Balneolaceae bacterium]
MRFRSLIVPLFAVAFLLSGCYTQLQYSQRINRITDDRPPTPGYSWDGDEERSQAYNEGEDSEYTEGYEDGYRRAVDDYPIYYRDYGVANWYDRHYYYHDPYFDWYYPYRSGLSISFYYGRPFGFSRLAFFHPFDYYWYPRHFGFYRPYYFYHPGFYSSFYGPQYYFYPGSHYFQTGFANFVGVGKEIERRYGRRSSVGTGRVAAGNSRIDRTGDRTRGRTAIQKAKSGRRSTVIRNRSSSGSDRGRSVRSRGRSSSSESGRRVRSSGRSRSGSDRGTVQRSRSGNRNNNYSSGPGTRSVDGTGVSERVDDDNGSRGVRINSGRFIPDRSRITDRNSSDLRTRIRNSRAPAVDLNRVDRTRFDERLRLFRRNTFFNSMSRRKFNNSRVVTPSRNRIINSRSNSGVRTRINSRSRSSGSSRGRSSSTRKSSGSSSKKRSRGGN